MNNNTSTDSRTGYAPRMKPSPSRLPLLLARSLVAAALASLATAIADAAEITGTVLNQGTLKYLERASVLIQETRLQTLTDSDGKFRFSSLPEGTYTLVVTYAGLDDTTRTLTVKDGEPAVIEVAMTAEEIYLLGEVVVTGAREGVSYAVNQQRRAESSRSVTSVDAFIDQSTGNPGEFLKNVEGIQMDYSQNEPQTIRIRGLSADLTSVTMDGNEIASAGNSTAVRAVMIDQMSIAAIDNVEVFKAPVPWMSANAIGGAVNFNTKSAFDQKGRRAFIQLGVNMDSHDFTYKKSPGPGHSEKAERRLYPVGRFEYSNSFFDNRLGVLFSAGYDHSNQLGSSTTHEVVRTDTPRSPAAQTAIPFSLENSTFRRGNFSTAPNRQLRVRSDISLNLDFKATDTVVLYLKSTLSDYHSTNRNHGWTLLPGAITPGFSPTDYTTTGGTASQSVSLFDKYTQTWQFNSGLKYKSGDWKAELAGGFSKSINHYKNPEEFGTLSIGLAGLGWSMTTPLHNSDPTSIIQNSGADFYNLNNYAPNQGNMANTTTINRDTLQGTAGLGNTPTLADHRANHGSLVSTNKRDTDNTKYTGRFDLRRDFMAGIPFNLRTGLAYSENIFDKQQINSRKYYWLGDDGRVSTDDYNSGANLGRFAEPVPVTMNIPGWTLREPQYMSMALLKKYWDANPHVIQENMANLLQQRIVGRQKVNETITAAYLCAQLFAGKFEILPGVRLEKTKLVAEGHRVLPNSVLYPGVNPNSIEGIRARYVAHTTSSSYDSDPFKYLHLKYEVTPDLQLRAAYTDAIGRPNLSQVLPSVSETAAGDYDGNTAGLKPQTSKNLDFSVEYYTKSSGQWTLGWFSRDIDDYIQRTSQPMTQDDALALGVPYTGGTLTTTRNIGYAKWQGIEFKFSQELREWAFMPKFLSGVTLWGNYTNNYKQDGVFETSVKIKRLANVVPEYYNAGVRYRSPRGKFSAHLSMNFQREKPTVNTPVVLTSEQYEALPTAPAATGANDLKAAYRTAQAAAQRQSEQDDYKFFNLELSYKLTKKLSLSCVGRNLLSERQTATENGIVRQRNQATGIAWTFAGKYDL